MRQKHQHVPAFKEKADPAWPKTPYSFHARRTLEEHGNPHGLLDIEWVEHRLPTYWQVGEYRLNYAGSTLQVRGPDGILRAIALAGPVFTDMMQQQMRREELEKKSAENVPDVEVVPA